MLKVICWYDGPRRVRNCNPHGADLLAVHERLLLKEAAAPYDVVVAVNGDGGPEPRPGVLVFHRENVGGPFGAYADVFAAYGKDYDWFLWQEDDVYLHDTSVFQEAVDYMKQNPKVGFVCLSPLSKSPCLHAGGGFGVGRREAMEAASKFWFKPPTNEYPDLERAEIAFTAALPELGWEIVNLPGVSPFAENWTKHESQSNHYEAFIGGRYVYRVGL